MYSENLLMGPPTDLNDEMPLLMRTMDLIRNGVIIDKMAVFSVGTSYVITKMRFVCRFHDMELLDNKDKGLVSIMWRCKIVPPRLKFWYQHKTTRICLVIKYVCLTLPLAAVCKH